MQLKCPGCSQLLNIPDAAAGKVVKCPCGKSLQVPAAVAKAPVAKAPVAKAPVAKAPVAKAPGPAARAPTSPATTTPRSSTTAARSAAATTPLASTATAPRAQSAVGSRPSPVASHAAPNPYAVSNDFDLTETDLAPVRGVVRPGQLKAAPKSNENELLRKYGKEEGGYENSIEGSHPAALKSMGGSNFISALFDGFILLLLMGFTSAMPIPPELGTAKGAMVVVMALFGGLDIAFLAGAGVSCFLPYRQCWFYLLFAYAFGFMMRLTIFISALRWESSLLWILIVSSWLIFSGITLAYLHTDEVRKFYDTRKVSKQMMFLFDGIGILLGGMFLTAFFLLTRSA
jgi:hypothetical protein